MVRRFSVAFARAYRAAELPFGIRPSNAWVSVGETHLDVRFGPWRVRTPRSNVIGAEVTGPYAFAKTAGPARLALTDRGLTVATDGVRGLRIDFAAPVIGLDPLGPTPRGV